METLPNNNAFPITTVIDGNWVKDHPEDKQGLTIRAYIATKAMQGWISALELSKIGNGDMENVIKLTAGYSTAFADALIEELNKEK